MTTTVSYHSPHTRKAPLLAAVAVAGLIVGVAAFAGVALEHQHSGTTTDPPPVVP